MTEFFPVSDKELLERTAELVAIERACAADVVEHLAEIERRRAYLDAACRSLRCYCIERLRYSEDQASLRVRVARLTLRFPQVLEELCAGHNHLTGLAMLAPVLTDANLDELLAAARGKSKAKLEELIARYFPKPDVPERVCPQPEQLAAPALSGSSGAPPAPPAKVAPLSESRWSVQLTIGAELKGKIDEARQLLSHAVPNGELATLVERAFDALLAEEKKKRFGTEKPRKQRKLKTGSRHIPVELVRIVWERDGAQCTFVDEEGNRCSAREALTIEHREAFALGGEATAENLCLLCAAHNRHTARHVFGEEHVERKIAESEYERAHRGLRNIGFSDKLCKKALTELRKNSLATGAKELIVEALALLVPDKPASMVRDCARPRWSHRSWDGVGHTSRLTGRSAVSRGDVRRGPASWSRWGAQEMTRGEATPREKDPPAAAVGDHS